MRAIQWTQLLHAFVPYLSGDSAITPHGEMNICTLGSISQQSNYSKINDENVQLPLAIPFTTQYRSSVFNAIRTATAQLNRLGSFAVINSIIPSSTASTYCLNRSLYNPNVAIVSEQWFGTDRNEMKLICRDSHRSNRSDMGVGAVWVS